MQLEDVDKKIHNCNLCGDMVEKFPKSRTVSLGNRTDIVIIGEAPANNGWRKSGIAWYGVDHKLLPSGKILQRLLNEINLGIEDTCFMEAIKCYPKDRKYLSTCGKNCRDFLFQQLDIIKPRIILTLGDIATKLVLDINYKRFSEVAGKEFVINGYTIIPMYHPSPVSPLSYKGNVEIMNKIKNEKKLIKTP